MSGRAMERSRWAWEPIAQWVAGSCLHGSATELPVPTPRCTALQACTIPATDPITQHNPMTHPEHTP